MDLTGWVVVRSVGAVAASGSAEKLRYAGQRNNDNLLYKSFWGLPGVVFGTTSVSHLQDL
jgi:hypothetical protein